MVNFEKLNLGLFLTDYKFRSKEILRGAISLTFLIVLFFILCKIFTGLSSSSFEILIPSFIISICLLIAHKKNVNAKVIQLLYLIFVFGLLEIHAIIYPTTLHALIYWFPFIPIAAIVVSGLKQAIVWFIVILIAMTANFLYVGYLVGDSYEINVNLNTLCLVAFVFTATTFTYTFLLYKLLGEAYSAMKVKSQDLEHLKDLSEYKKQKMQDFQKSLFDLSKDPAVVGGDFNLLYRKICQVAMARLGINRVSIWIFVNKTHALERKHLSESAGGTDEFIEINKEKYPHYFKTILSQNYIAAEDAFNHPDTAEFLEHYLKPLDIHALLDCPIILDGKPIGLICCENQNKCHPWSAEDILFVQSLSDFIALGFKSSQIRTLLHKIRCQNRDLIGKRKEIEAYNEELSALNEELTIMNESLEVTVQNRTSVLEQKNKQLREYAFINSHLLRAPLSRILGLSYIISKEKLNVKDARLLKALMDSSQELDAIVKKISSLLYKGSDFSRQDVHEIIERNLNGNGENH